MSILARVTMEHPAGQRASARRRIRLSAGRLDASLAAQDILIHDLSLGGCSFASRYAAAPGAALRLRIPDVGEVDAQATWSDGERVGCAFTDPLTRAQLAAALATSPVIWGDFPPNARTGAEEALPIRARAPDEEPESGWRWPDRLAAMALGAGLVAFWVLVAALV